VCVCVYYTCMPTCVCVCVMQCAQLEDACMSYEEEDTCMSYEEEDTCMSLCYASAHLIDTYVCVRD